MEKQSLNIIFLLLSIGLVVGSLILGIKIFTTPPTPPVAKPQHSADFQPETYLQATAVTGVCEAQFSLAPQSCYRGACNTNADCEQPLICQTIGQQKTCINPSCPLSTNCICPTPTPTPSPSPTPTPSPSPSTSPTPTPTPTPQPSGSPEPTPGCYFRECDVNRLDSSKICPQGLTCTMFGTKYQCVNKECPSDTDCTCNTPTPTGSPKPVTHTDLPKAGNFFQTAGLYIGGVGLIILGILFL